MRLLQTHLPILFHQSHHIFLFFRIPEDDEEELDEEEELDPASNPVKGGDPESRRNR